VTKLLLLGLALGLAGCAKPGERAVHEADELFRQARWEEAAAAYSELPEESGGWRAYGAYRAATIYRNGLHAPRRAEQAYEECVQAWAETEYGYLCQVELGDLMRDGGRPRASIDAYRSAVQLDPDGRLTDHALLHAGLAYVKLGDPAQARVEWEELLERAPRSALRPRAELEIARSWDLQGEFVEASKAYATVRSRWPDDDVFVQASFGLAEALEQLGRLDEAEEHLVALLESHPNPKAVQIKLDGLRSRRERRDREPPAVMDRGRQLNR
jgi:tetratricopeptide (TPR) repeat protein